MKLITEIIDSVVLHVQLNSQTIEQIFVLIRNELKFNKCQQHLSSLCVCVCLSSIYLISLLKDKKVCFCVLLCFSPLDNEKKTIRQRHIMTKL